MILKCDLKMAKSIWYQKFSSFFRTISKCWFVIPIILTVFNAISTKLYRFENMEVSGKSLKVVIGESIDFTSFRAIGNYVLLSIFLFLVLVQKFFKDREKNAEINRIRQFMDNLCEQIHGLLKLDQTSRVTIFDMKDGFLEISGRFSVYSSRPDTAVRFSADMGSVGIAYRTGSLNLIEDLPEFEPNPEEYYTEMQKKANMDRASVDKLGRKHRSYLSVPIKYYNSGRVCSVLVIDSSEPDLFKRNQGIFDEVSTLVSNHLVRILFPRELSQIGG
jgi:hypothetical protein